MEFPLPLVTGGKGWTISEEAIEIISRVQKPLVIVGVVGKYRTGKSYLLNMMKDSDAPFPLGNTIQSQTKGIWFSIEDHPEDPNKSLLLLDTEGLFDAEKEDSSHDVELFVLVVLLTSVLIYNTQGTIDSQALEGLRLATSLTDRIRTSQDETSCEFGRFFPVLVWAVRDHHLKLVIDGNEVTSDQYLEHCLTLKANIKRNQEYNELRLTIRDYFHERKCFVFPRPVQEEEKLSELEAISSAELQPSFLTATERFLKYIFREGPTKNSEGQAWTGSVFCTFLKLYIDGLRKGLVDIPSAYESMLQIENEKAFIKAIDKYRELMPIAETYPREEEELKDLHARCFTEANKLFIEQSAGTTTRTEFSEKLQDTVTDVFNGISAENDKRSMEDCTALLIDLYGPIEESVKNSVFTNPGGFTVYKRMMEELILQYNQNTEKRRGPRKETVLTAFLQSKEVLGQSILAADSRLTKAEKKELEQIEHAKLLERERIEKDKEIDRMNLKLEQERKMAMENWTELRKSMEKEHMEHIREIEEDARKKGEEAKRLESENFKKEAEEMRTRLAASELIVKELKENGFFSFVGKAIDTGLKDLVTSLKGLMK